MSKKLAARGPEFYSKLDAAEEKIKKQGLDIDYNGHFAFEKEYLLSEMHFALFWLPDESVNLLADGQKLPSPEVMNLGVHQCTYCAEYLEFSFDGQNLTILGKCANPGGFKDVTIELNVPSGRMVFANDLRQWFKIHGSYNVNLDIGMLQTTQAYEKVGMAHGFVGNTCPSVYKESKTALTISGSPQKDEWDETTREYVQRDSEEIEKEIPQGKRVGSICTDLWWYSIVDYDDFKARFLDVGGTQEQFGKYLKSACTVVKVTPGVFKVQHFFVRRHVPEGEPLHYAKVTWARAPEKSHLYEEYKKMDRTIGQCYLAAMSQYPSLHGFKDEELPRSLTPVQRKQKLLSYPIERIEDSFQLFLDHTFCVLGGGVDWHRNGWGTTVEIPEDTPDFEMPRLTKKYRWYPMSREYCALYLGAIGKAKRGDEIKFNETFLAATYNVIHSMLRYGVDTYERTKESEKEAQEQVKIAQESLNALSVRYPDSVPDWCRDLVSVES